MKAKGSFFLGNKKFEVRDMDFDELGPHEVLVKNMAAGICGTDVHIYHGEPGSAEVVPPIVLGHEFSGVVEAVGNEVKVVEVGDHVTMDPNIYCGECYPCRMGKKQNCENLRALGVNMNGGFAQYCVTPESQCFKLNKDLDFTIGAMTEPLACAIHGIDRADIKEGQSVLVIGGGTIGLLMVQLARLAGAAVVILSEPIEMRRKIATEIGADATIDPLNENVNDRIFDITGHHGVDVVIECVGKVFATEQAISAAGVGANIVLFSVPSVDAKVSLPLFDMYKKELRIMASFINPDTHQRAVNLLNSNRLKIKELITHFYPLDHVEDAILMQMKNESIKVMVKPQE
jgi:2-desacetyl-2-hydroxyethyl bacteriochlorophyllide A dehydrogenase